MGQPEHLKHGPTHVCPRCGEWWDVEGGEKDTWYVVAHDNEDLASCKVWTETAATPICPDDQAKLSRFCIAE